MTYLEDEARQDRAYPPGAVVVGYNSTAHSTAALAWAAAEATRREVALVVLYAADYPGMPMERGAGLRARNSGAMEAAQEVTRRGVAEALAAYPGLRVVAATELTSPPRALTEASAQAMLVVLGSRGYGRVAGALLGSVAFAVASRATCPIVVVKEQDAERPSRPDHPVVIGTDGSPEAAAALWFAAGHAVATSTPLEIITSTGTHEQYDVDQAELHAAADRIAGSAKDWVHTNYPSLPVTVQVEDGPAERTLVNASERASMVVVGTRGRGAFEAMLLGSVSHAVIHGATCPVAVVGLEPVRA